MTLHQTDDPSAAAPRPDPDERTGSPAQVDDVAPHDASGKPVLDRTVFGLSLIHI